MNELVIGLGGNLGSDDQLLARFDDVAADFARRGRVRASHVYRSDALVAALEGYRHMQSDGKSEGLAALKDAYPARRPRIVKKDAGTA